MKKKRFKKLLGIYTCLLLILATIFLLYIRKTLIEYENSNEENFIKYKLNKISGTDLEKFIKDNNVTKGEYETSTKSIVNSYKKILKNKDIKVEQNEKNSFDVLYESRKMFAIELENVGHEKKLGMLSYIKWDIKSITPYLERGLLYYDIYAPSNVDIIINGKEINKDKSVSSEKIKNLEELYYYENMPKLLKYEINDLIENPTINVLVNNKKETTEVKSYEIIIDNVFAKYDTFEEVKKQISGEIDVLKIAETWSLFLTKDLTGASYGLNTVNEFLVEDSYMSKMAYNWSHGIDITFTSQHRLKTPIFTNEKLSNFMVYDENAFSCDVYLEKNMIVKNTDKIDIMNDRLYFIKLDNEWKLVMLEAIVN